MEPVLHTHGDSSLLSLLGKLRLDLVDMRLVLLYLLVDAVNLILSYLIILTCLDRLVLKIFEAGGLCKRSYRWAGERTRDECGDCCLCCDSWYCVLSHLSPAVRVRI